MNTGRSGVDFGLVRQTMDRLLEAASMPRLCEALDAAAAAVGLTHFVALDVVETQPQLGSALHNVTNVDLARVVRSDLAASLLSRPIPIPMNHALGIDALRFGVAASAFHGRRTCLLFVGRSSDPVAEGSLVELLGTVSMFASHALESLVRLGKASCPLSARELQCLGLALQGLSAKETARRLEISHRTVEEHLANCRGRLAATTTQSAGLQALRKGWLSIDDIEASAAAVSPPSKEG